MKDIDKLFAELRTSEPYLADGGFSAVVMAQLPSNRELPLWLKNLILLGATALGSSIVAMQLPAGDLGSLLLAAASLPALDIQSLLAAAAQNLPVILMASVAFGYLLPYGAVLVAERDAF